MPSHLEPRFLGLAVFLPLASCAVALGFWWGWVLLALPFVFWLVSAWLLIDVLGLRESRVGLVSYTFEHIWNAGALVRGLTVISLLVTVLGGLVWLGTADLREERSRPTWAGRATSIAAATTDKASDMGDRAVAAGKGWIDRAKGWFD